MFARIVESYRRTTKPRDLIWNRFVARPLAAVLLVPLERAPVTPNQVTFASLVVFVAAVAMMVTLPGQQGLLLAVVVAQLSYVLDCVDGQLARLRGTSSPVGAHLDFLMDELKAFLLVAATGVRLWRADGETLWLVEGLLALVAVASAISLTTFMRRPEYKAAAGGASGPAPMGDYGDGFAKPAGDVPSQSRSPIRSLLQGVEAIGRFVVHYPSYLVFIAIADRLDLFLHGYLIMNAAYAARSLLVILLKLGKPGRPGVPAR